MVAGRRVVLFGRATISRYNELVLENPEFEFLEAEDAEGIHTGRIVPVYRKQADLSAGQEDNAKLFAKWNLPEPGTYPDPTPAYHQMLRNRGLL